jgi:hypothetical protein
MVLTRRALFSGLLGVAAAGCAVPEVAKVFEVPGIPVTLRPGPIPADRAAVFQALLRGQPVPPLDSPESPWLVGAEAPATVTAVEDGLEFVALPERRAWASPRLPLTPLGARLPGQIEELTWDASITISPERRYFILCELRFAGEPGALLIQPTPFDIQVTHDSERPGGGTSDSLSHLVVDGKVHLWRLRLDQERTELRLNGTVVWTFDGARSLSRVAFGETRTDRHHGGTMRLRDVVYVRRPAW